MTRFGVILKYKYNKMYVLIPVHWFVLMLVTQADK